MAKTKDKGDTGLAATPSYEQAYERLREIVNQLEAGDMDLERSLSTYEEGIKLARYCQGLLENAELRVRELSKGALQTFSSDNQSAEDAD